jgi:SAM-dependent methyltransferase
VKLKEISGLTLEHYNRNAENFREGTRDHDVSQNIEALLRAIEGDPPFAILDFGCGPGRDLKTFTALGHIAVGLEGASRLAAMARADTGREVWEQEFLNLDLPDRRFDGVFANPLSSPSPIAARNKTSRLTGSKGPAPLPLRQVGSRK